MPGVIVLTFCRWAIGLAFAWSAAGKAVALSSFRDAITDFGVIPARWSGAAALVTISAEALAAAGAAAGGGLALAGFGLSLVLLVVFSAILAAALRRKARFSCNCFGPSERTISWYDVARNVVLGLCCAAGLWNYQAGAAGYPAPALVITLGLAAACLVCIAANLDDIIWLLRKPSLYD
jgi:hypothetical protein